MADSKPLPPPNPLPVAGDEPSFGVMRIEEFTSLASKLVSFSMHKEAISLYETAVKLHPENLALKINLARVRDMKRRADERVLRDLDENIQEKREREDRLANHAMGLGYLHYRRGDLDRARDLLDFARSCNGNLYVASLFLGKIHLGRNDFEKALSALEDARRANPYSEEVQSLLGRLYMEKGDTQRALHAFIDALVLTGEPEPSKHPFYQQNITELLRRLGFTEADLPAVIQERSLKFNALSDRIDRVRRDRTAYHASAKLGSMMAALSQASRPTSEALALRRFLPLERVSEEDLIALNKVLRRDELTEGGVLFGERASTGRLYFIDRGSVRVQRSTPFGDVVLATYAPGQVLGEMDFLDGKGHSASAVAVGETTLLTVSREDLQKLFETRKHFSVQCLSYFWRSLAEHIRTTNEQMKSFFVNEARDAEQKPDEKQSAKAEEVKSDLKKKLDLLHEKGLSVEELNILATLSTEERYGANDLIFIEGAPGTKLYIVLEGKVRISKTIPGVGEEALAIMERGDFFGEMALVDEKPRSADARAHEPGTTVLAIDKRVLDDILSHDLRSAEQFLTILCRILCQRLREINETIVKWKIMSGGF